MQDELLFDKVLGLAQPSKRKSDLSLFQRPAKCFRHQMTSAIELQKDFYLDRNNWFLLETPSMPLQHLMEVSLQLGRSNLMMFALDQW